MSIPRMTAAGDRVSDSARPPARYTGQVTTAHGKCGACMFKPGCLPADLEGTRLSSFEHQIWRYSRPVKAGQILVHQGDVIDSLYALRVGSLKAYIDEADGTERVMAFRFPGAIIGLAEPYQKQWVTQLRRARGQLAVPYSAERDARCASAPIDPADERLSAPRVRIASHPRA